MPEEGDMTGAMIGEAADMTEDMTGEATATEEEEDTTGDTVVLTGEGGMVTLVEVMEEGGTEEEDMTGEDTNEATHLAAVEGEATGPRLLLPTLETPTLPVVTHTMGVLLLEGDMEGGALMNVAMMPMTGVVVVVLIAAGAMVALQHPLVADLMIVLMTGVMTGGVELMCCIKKRAHRSKHPSSSCGEDQQEEERDPRRVKQR